MRALSYDLTELIFRILFSLIFLGLGLEHLFSDQMIQEMMPDWLISKRLFSVLAGLVLLTGGLSVLTGYQTVKGGISLGVFLIVVTVVIHLPALLRTPVDMPLSWHWLWAVYQKSNLVKNLCLLGVCFHLINHKPGRYSLDEWLAVRRGRRSGKARIDTHPI